MMRITIVERRVYGRPQVFEPIVEMIGFDAPTIRCPCFCPRGFDVVFNDEVDKIVAKQIDELEKDFAEIQEDFNALMLCLREIANDAEVREKPEAAEKHRGGPKKAVAEEPKKEEVPVKKRRGWPKGKPRKKKVGDNLAAKPKGKKRGRKATRGRKPGTKL